MRAVLVDTTTLASSQIEFLLIWLIWKGTDVGTNIQQPNVPKKYMHAGNNYNWYISDLTFIL